MRWFLWLVYMPKIVYGICMYVRVRVHASVKNTRKKNLEKSCGNIWWIGINVLTLHPDKPKNLNITIMATKTKRANSAQTTKKVNNRRAAAAAAKETAVEAVPVVEAVEVEIGPFAALPVSTETESESGKVSRKDVLKAAGSLRAAVKEERRGANCTIRLIAERAASGDAAAVDILCALCDVPRAALFSLNIDTIRAAVNAYYPFYIETDGRKVSVKPVGVWYSSEPTQVGKVKANEPIEDAAKRVQRGYMVVPVADYLDQLIKAAKSRAKGITPRRVDAEAIYDDIALSEAAAGITATEIDEAKKRRAYSPNGVNVWHKDRTGFYI